MKAYLISDTHFNHENIKTYCQRPDNFTELIYKNWRNTVGPDDLLIHCGDWAIGHTNDAVEELRKLPGKKVLVRGNHDTKSCVWYTSHGWDFSCDGFQFRNCLISHKPADRLPSGCDLNIHGHLHNVWDGFGESDPNKDGFTKIKDLGHLYHSYQRLFAVEYTNYFPIEFDKFINHPDRYQARGPKPDVLDCGHEKSELCLGNKSTDMCTHGLPAVFCLICGVDHCYICSIKKSGF